MLNTWQQEQNPSHREPYSGSPRSKQLNFHKKIFSSYLFIVWRISIVGLKHLRSFTRDADKREIVCHIVQVIECWFQTKSYQTLEALRASFVLPYVWNQDPSRWSEDSLSWCCIPGKQSRCQERCSSSPDWNSPQDHPWFLVYLESLFLYWFNSQLIYLAVVARLNKVQERAD